jgi:hypothetical protein
MTSLGSVFSGTNAPIAKSIAYHLERAAHRNLRAQYFTLGDDALGDCRESRVARLV